MPNSSVLRTLLHTFLDGDIPLYELRARFYSNEILLVDDSDDGLYKAVSMHLAMYTVGTWPESVLKEAIIWHIASKNGEDVPPKVPMLDKQWIDIMGSGIAPWPLKMSGHPDHDLK